MLLAFPFKLTETKSIVTGKSQGKGVGVGTRKSQGKGVGVGTPLPLRFPSHN